MSLFESSTLLCDSSEVNKFFTENISNENINSNNIEDNNNGNIDSTEFNNGLFFKIKRKLSWHIYGKKSGEFNSYNDFKNSFNSKIKFRDIIKKDFKSTCNAAEKHRNISQQQNANLMDNIRKSNAQSNIIKQRINNINQVKK